MLMKFKMQHGHWTALVDFEDLLDIADSPSRSDGITHYNPRGDFSVNNDARGTLYQHRPRVVPPRAWWIGYRASERDNSYHDPFFNSLDHLTLRTIEINTLVDVVFTLDPKCSGMITNRQTRHAFYHGGNVVTLIQGHEVKVHKGTEPGHATLYGVTVEESSVLPHWSSLN